MKGFRLQVLGYSIFAFLFILFPVTCTLSATYAIVDPLSVPNNKFGIHLISASPDESSPAAQLVNTNGDWGYVTVLMEQKDKRLDKWQEFFNDLRRRHLIPIIRIATEPEGNNWKIPNPDDCNSWADFLNSLIWPTKNRYVVIYNEPNHALEWGGVVDSKSYAQILDKMITVLKSRSEDFFVLNAGFDASSPEQPPNYGEEALYLQQMNQAVPGIFERLDGWSSHSYPNPAFAGSPSAYGRGTVRTYEWEMQQLKNLGVSKDLPIFITETGWKHAEGLVYDRRFPSADTLSDYYKEAFENAWNSSKIVAVTPFLLNYQEIPFDHFSFKKITGEKQEEKIPLSPDVLGVQYPDYYSFYQTIKDMSKTSGKPTQEAKAKLSKGEIYSSIVARESYSIALTFTNTGQSIWTDQVKLVPIQGAQELGIQTVEIPKDIKVEPNQEYTFHINLKAPAGGTFKVSLNLFQGSTQFESKPIEVITVVKAPVVLQLLSKLKWKKSPEGDYILKVNGVVGNSAQRVSLDSSGKSKEIETRYLLPDYTFNFTLEKPYYHPKTLKQKVIQGSNILDFGELQPDFISTLLHPKELWNLLPFSK